MSKPIDDPSQSGIYAKLFAIQSELPKIPKTSINPHFKSKYADLPTIMDILGPILIKHKILLLQPIYESPNSDVLTIGTRFIDLDSNQRIDARATVPIGNNKTPQAFGSAVTYARRYALCSFLGIIADEDDDGNASSATTSKLSQSHVIALYELAKSQGYTKDDILAKLKPRGIHRIDQLTQELYDKFMIYLKENPKKGE